MSSRKGGRPFVRLQPPKTSSQKSPTAQNLCLRGHENRRPTENISSPGGLLQWRSIHSHLIGCGYRIGSNRSVSGDRMQPRFVYRRPSSHVTRSRRFMFSIPRAANTIKHADGCVRTNGPEPTVICSQYFILSFVLANEAFHSSEENSSSVWRLNVIRRNEF